MSEKLLLCDHIYKVFSKASVKFILDQTKHFRTFLMQKNNLAFSISVRLDNFHKASLV